MLSGYVIADHFASKDQEPSKETTEKGKSENWPLNLRSQKVCKRAGSTAATRNSLFFWGGGDPYPPVISSLTFLSE